jgi:phenylacetate-CoA ligase
MSYTRDFSKAPAAARAGAIFYGGTQYSGVRSMIGLFRHWRRVRKTMMRSDGYLGHHIWYRFPFTFGTVSFFESQRQLMEFPRAGQHQRAEHWMYLPGVAEGAFFRLLTPGPAGYTHGIWSADGSADPDDAPHGAGLASTLEITAFQTSPNGAAAPSARIGRRRTPAGTLLGCAELALKIPRVQATLDALGRDRLPARIVERLGVTRAEHAVRRAVATVPAMQAFHDQAGPDAQYVQIGSLNVPITDKANYILQYAIAERCVGGRLPARGVSVDESSGSSGTPNNWVRTTAERRVVQANISTYVRTWLGDEPYITINAFSLGAWATGLNMGAALERGSIVKNTGPDAQKILATLEFFGPSHRFLVCAYPPFLKHLVDLARDAGIDLTGYRLAALVGGEGMSEGLRDYLRPVFDPLFSGYGASDVEIGLAGETQLSVALRRLAWKDERVRTALFGDNPRLPMLFQYNPFEYFVTTTPEDELVYTITRPGVLAPVIAYNLHDEGGVASARRLAGRLASVGVDLRELIRRHPGTSQAPFVWVFGRKDSTVSVMGANVYPEDIEQSVYAIPALASVTRSYCLGVVDLPDGLRRAVASFEVTAEITDELAARFDEAVFEGIHRRSPDFREAYKNRPDLVRPLIQLHGPGDGPFADGDWRIKQRRLLSQQSHA